MIHENCPDCGLADGHANRCYVNVLRSRLLAVEHVAERAGIFVRARHDHARLVAEMKLKDAVRALEIVERRLSRKASGA